jgi:probable F420-dependent oxidoreductase
MSAIKFGVRFPTGMEGMMYPVPFCDPEDLYQIAQEAEDGGFDSIGGNDHIVTQEYVKKSWKNPPRYYEIFETFSYLAAKTEILRFNTAVTVLPFREPIWVAKQAATLDQLSGGRLILGVGVGAYREEFEAVYPQKNARRGDIMDEYTEVLSMLLKGETSYRGKHINIEGVDLCPKALQVPFPMYIGGNHMNNLERAVKWGDGWEPAGLTPEEIGKSRERWETLCERHGRSPRDIDIAPQLVCCIGKNQNEAIRAFKKSQVYEHLRSLSNSTLKDQSMEKIIQANLIGNPERIIEALEEYQKVDVTHFPAIIFAANSVEKLIDQMRIFSEEVIQSF